MEKALRILILEDVLTDAELALRELRQAGLEVTSLRVESEGDFVRALTDFAPDLILADYSLPQFDGLSAVKLVQALCPLVPVIVVSAILGEEQAIESLKLGATDYVLKQRLERLGPVAKRALREAAERRDRKRAEGQIHYLATVLENVSDGIVSTDLNDTIQSWNSGAEAMFGYRAEEVVGRPYAAVLAYEFMEGSEPAPAQPLPDNGRWKGELRVRRKDGTFINVLVAGAVLKDTAGTATGFSAVLHDITERKVAEAALIESSAQFRTLFEASPDAIMLIDPHGDWPILDCNTAACQMNGYTRAELIGQSVDLLNLTSGSPEERAEYFRRVTQSPVIHLETYHRRKDGTVVPIEVSTSLITLGGRGVVLGIDRDITERKQRERELEAIVAVSTALRVANTQAQMLPIVLAQVTMLVNADAAALALRDLTTDELVIALGQGEMADLAGRRLPAGAGIGGQALASGRPYVTDNIAADPHFHQLQGLNEARAAACVPLITNRLTLGVLWAKRAAPFAEVEVRVLSAIAGIAASALQRAALHEQTERRLQHLSALREIDSAIMNSTDLSTTLIVLLGHVRGQLGVDASDILLLSPGLKVLEYAAGHGFRSAAIQQSRLRLGQGHAGQAALTRRLVSVPDLRSDPLHFHRAALLAGEEFVALFCVPLVARGQVLGVLEVFHRTAIDPHADWLSFLETLAGQAAIAVADARLFSDLQRSNVELLLAYDTTLEGWSAALDLRDRETEGHSQRVTNKTLQLARAMGVGAVDLKHMRRGALLHDIGKMGIPDAILYKPGPLTEAEWVIMRQHPQNAYKLLSPMTFLQPALDIPYGHHEKWDGTGYPRQLKGEEIPLSARIFAVVDVWDALRSDRPYRRGWPEDKVLAYILDQAGKHFDPEVVKAFVALAPGAP